MQCGSAAPAVSAERMWHSKSRGGRQSTLAQMVARVVTATNAHTDWKLLQLIAYLRNTGVKCAQ